MFDGKYSIQTLKENWYKSMSNVTQLTEMGILLEENSYLQCLGKEIMLET